MIFKEFRINIIIRVALLGLSVIACALLLYYTEYVSATLVALVTALVALVTAFEIYGIYYKEFRTNIIIRVVLLGLSVIACALLIHYAKYVSAALVALVTTFEIYGIYYFVETTNRKLNTFLDAIKYADFTANFQADNHLGKTFKNLNQSLKNVLDAFRETRRQNEENLQYLDTLVQNVTVGILSYDQKGNIELLNTQACRLLEIRRVKFLNDLKIENPEAYKAINGLKAGENIMLRQSNDKYLAIQVTEMKLRNKIYRLISIQNIQSELQQKELEAWQNLTKVLRHEIMNSITPISSLVSTLNDIFEEEINKKNTGPISDDVVSDITEALQTINNRSIALKNFVEGYRNFTQIPKPEIQSVPVKDLFKNIHKLMQAEIKKNHIQFTIEVLPSDLKLRIDPNLVEMVLINLVKNAIEAGRKKQDSIIRLRAFYETGLLPMIEVEDNGPGIIPEAMGQIFIPFYSTKPGGSGIGLSLSRQIMHLHHGNLTVESKTGKTVFRLRF